MKDVLVESIWKQVCSVQENCKKRLITRIQVEEFLFWAQHLYEIALDQGAPPSRIYLEVDGGTIPRQYADKYLGDTTSLRLFNGTIHCDRQPARIYKTMNTGFRGGITGSQGGGGAKKLTWTMKKLRASEKEEGSSLS